MRASRCRSAARKRAPSSLKTATESSAAIYVRSTLPFHLEGGLSSGYNARRSMPWNPLTSVAGHPPYSRMISA